MPITVSPQEFGDRWAQGLQGSTQKITQGVNAVTVAPSTKAIAQKAKMVQNFTLAVNSGKWERNLGKITLNDWKTSMTDKGIPRIGQGAIAATPKMVAFATKLLPFEQTLQNTVRNLPSLTLQNRIDRAVAWMNGMNKFVNS